MKIMRKAQSGFSLVSAIFLLVVIAALGTFAVTLSTTQQQSAALDVMGSRAYQASRAGIEWGAYQVLRNPGAGFELACNPGGGGGAAAQVIAPLPNTLSVFNVNVVCNSFANNEAGVIVTLYRLTSTAQQGVAGTPDFVERQISVSIAR